MKKLEILREKFQKISIQRMISLYFTLVAVGGMLFIAVLLYINFFEALKDMMAQRNVQLTEQTNQYLDSHLRNIMKTSDAIYYQVIKNADFETESIKDKMELLYNANREQLVSIALFNEFGRVVDAVPLSKLKDNIIVMKSEWFLNAEKKIQELHFSTPHVQNLFHNQDYRYRWVVSLSRHVEITKGGKTEDGVLLVDMNFSGIEQVCRSANMGRSGYVYLMDKEGEIIYHPRQQLLYSGLEVENNKLNVSQEDGSYIEKFSGKNRMVTIRTVGYTGWKLVAVMPISDILEQNASIMVFLLFIMVFGLLIMCLASLFVSHRIADPIKRLEKSVQKLERGEYDTDIIITGSYEIRHLGKAIGSMVMQMRRLMDEIVKEQELKRKTELEALQTQINPHFLYNTLDSVVWMVENERYDGAVTMVMALARLFRISISKGKSIITVKEEMEHARYYLTIQKIRYKNKFTYSVEAEESVLSMATVKLIIQPMIENAIYHGMEYMTEEDDGFIIVKAYEKEKELYIDIIDNGIGITPDVAEKLIVGERKSKNKGSGIGMRNVHERIQLYFGRDYGVEVTSEPDEGTKVTIHMPMVPIEEVEER